MSNFQFLHTEFRPLYEPARSAEQLVWSDPRACCMRTRHALEQAVHWLYDNDRTLRMPYDRSLNVLLTQPEFEGLLPPPVYAKARLIQKMGNQAVHSARPVVPLDAMKLVRELFHLLFWLARTYTRASNPKSIEARFDDKLVPRLVRSDEASALSRDELKKQEARFSEQIDRQHKVLEQREAALAEAAATIEAREAALAEMDAERARLRAEVARAKAANIKVPDEHDYNEAETRKLLIDVLLREAGWVVGETAGEEVPVTGMPNVHAEGFVDYVLWGADGKPLALVEAKRTTRDPDVGQQQAKLYADCLEKMKGQRPLIFYSNGFATWLWDDRRAPPREVQGFYTRDELELAITRRELQTSPAAIDVNPTIAGRSYQKRAIASMCEAMNQGRRRGLLAMATGTGKTRTAIALADVLMRANWVKRVLFLADRVALVNQATKAFKTHLPDSSPVNLVTEKTGQGRVYLSTYPTMMGLIDQMKDGRRPFGVGHFDLVIIDEAHRSVYQKYGAIFRYFDSYLIGLTATPRDEVDRDTYHLFGLETGVPTDAYGLDEAVADGYLVPPRASSVPIKFVREGIRYDELPEEEKEHWESLDWGERDGVEDLAPTEIHASQINKQLYNEHTVDLMLQHLMEHGLTVDGGDTLGKTIIFAANQAHADFIARRFNHHYPHYRGEFARVITYNVNYAQSLIDDFSHRAKLPQIAISVDMLDTGIDVPEVLNLVFFKAVRSKVKFLQMIGRGTRLCPELFGPGQDKTEFLIFDFCGNFEYFNEHPGGARSAVGEPLTRKLFKHRLELLVQLPVRAGDDVRELSPGEDELATLRQDLADELHGEVAAMNPDNFIVRPQREHVCRFAERGAWDALDDAAVIDLREQVAGLPSERDNDDITARLFDLTCLQMQLSVVGGTAEIERLRQKVMKLASDLESKDAIPAVKAQLPLIQEIQSEEYWQDITLPMLESLRRKLRALIQFVDKTSMKPVYTVLTDEKGEASEVGLKDFSTGINIAQYKRKVEGFIRANENHVAIAKLKHNKPLTPQDLGELERFVFESGEAESRERFTQVYGDEQPLAVFIRSLVGLDRNAAKEALGQFLDTNRYSSAQIRFVEMIIERLTQHGVMDPGLLYEPPFTSVHYEGLDGVFPGAGADALVDAIRVINRNAQAA